MKMALDQFGIGGIGGLFEKAQQAQPSQLQAQQVSSADLLGGNLGFGGGQMDMDSGGMDGLIDSGAEITGDTTSTVSGQPAIGTLDAQKDISRLYNPTSSSMPGLIPKINQNPLQGLQFFLNMLAMQDTAKESQGKVQGLMSGIQTLIKNEFPSADFEGGMGVKQTFPMGIF